MNAPERYDDRVVRALHEVAKAACEVPVEAQPPRLQNALVQLVALGVLNTGTWSPAGRGLSS